MLSYHKKKIALFTLFSVLIPNLVFGAQTNYNYVISDSDLENYNSMNRSAIQDFLRSQDSYLATYKYSGNNPSPAQLTLDPTKKYFQTRNASEIIYNSAQEWKINPQFLLTMLEKEMSLISHQSPEANRLYYAMGYDCPDSGGCAFRTKGFGKQVRASAEQFRWYVDHIYQYSWQPNKSACADDPYPYLPCTSRGTIVTPENKITAAMYLYTPHIHGNMLFATLWNQYGFGGLVDQNDDLPIVVKGFLPDGALVKAKDSEEGTIYLIVDSKKRPFSSMTALISRFDPDKVLLVEQEELDKYELGADIAHANYTVLENSKGDRYLIDGLSKRLIISDEAFRQLGFNPDEIEEASTAELAAYLTSEQLDASSTPFAELWQPMDSETVYLVKDGQKHRVIDQFIIDANFPEMEIREVTAKTLENLSSSTPIKLLDGTLIKKDLDARVYVISNGERRLIPDGATFDKLGYNWTQIKTISTKIMNFHRLGEQILSQE